MQMQQKMFDPSFFNPFMMMSSWGMPPHSGWTAPPQQQQRTSGSSSSWSQRGKSPTPPAQQRRAAHRQRQNVQPLLVQTPAKTQKLSKDSPSIYLNDNNSWYLNGKLIQETPSKLSRRISPTQINPNFNLEFLTRKDSIIPRDVSNESDINQVNDFSSVHPIKSVFSIGQYAQNPNPCSAIDYTDLAIINHDSKETNKKTIVLPMSDGKVYTHFLKVKNRVPCLIDTGAAINCVSETFLAALQKHSPQTLLLQS